MLEQNKQGYESYIDEEKKQKELKIRKKEFDTLKENKKNMEISIDGCNKIINLKSENINEKEISIKNIEAELKDKKEQIENEVEILNKALLELEQERRNIDELKFKQDKLELEKTNIDKNNVIIQNFQNNITRLEKETTKEKEVLNLKEKLVLKIKSKEKIEEEKNYIEDKLSKISAKLEQTKESMKIAESGICPYLKSECINVKGKTKEEYLQEIKVINKAMELVKEEKENIVKQEKDIIKAETELKNIIIKIQEIEETKKEIENLKKEIKEKNENSDIAKKAILQILSSYGVQSLQVFEEFSQMRQKEFSEKDKQYNIMKTNLENSKKEQDKQIADLEKNKEAINKIILEIEKQNENIHKCQEEIKIIEKDLEKYSTIEQLLEENENKLQETKKSHDIYIQNKDTAQKAEIIKINLEKALYEIKIIESELKENNSKLENLSKVYDECKLKETEENRNKLTILIAEINTKIETSDARLNILEKNVDELRKVQELLKEINKKIKIYEKAIEYLTRIRQIIKQAPEDISEILIQKVSRKATEIYSKIANDNTRLEWREGYEVILVDNVDGKKIEKEFRQLSGGEQMSAALAIRISMLEILTSLQIGILDEPTVNMDVGRRQRLAEIIESIGGFFVQLFVVSHDDTFNSITENMIQL